MYRDKSQKRPPALVSLFRGLYNRVARQLGVDTSYVSRVARGERKSETVTAALSKEVQKLLELTANHNGNHSRATSTVAAKKETAKKEKAKKEEANLTVARVKKEMAQPRFAKSARIGG
jgi:transcriptional regulator with XRE-family HTH domain